jgi:hypothetical protein
MPVDRFLYKHIALFRPRLRTFHILQLSESGKWIPYILPVHPNTIRLRKSFDHDTDTAILHLPLRSMTVVCSGYYLETFDETLPKYIPVCRKAPGQTWPSALTYAIPYPSTPFIEFDSVPLWISEPYRASLSS